MSFPNTHWQSAPATGSSLLHATCVFVFLVAAAWFVSPGISVAVAWYGSALISERLFRLYRSSATSLQRSLRLTGLALVWLAVLAWSGLILPSNFSGAVI